MNTDYIKQLPVGGFNYDNCIRNKALLESNALGENKLSHMKTGTTICGAIFNVSSYFVKVLSHFKLKYRKVLSSPPIPELQVDQPSETRTVRRFIIWLQISTAQVQEPPLIVIM